MTKVTGFPANIKVDCKIKIKSQIIGGSIISKKHEKPSHRRGDKGKTRTFVMYQLYHDKIGSGVP